MRPALETEMLLQLPLKVRLLARRLLRYITTTFTAFRPTPPPIAREQLQHALTIYLNGVTISNCAGSTRARARLHDPGLWKNALVSPHTRALGP